jgi:hypothetical protein
MLVIPSLKDLTGYPKFFRTINDIEYEFSITMKIPQFKWFLTVSDKHNPALVLLNTGPYATYTVAKSYADSLEEITP